MMVFANIIGSIMNKILPEGIIMIILIVVILGGIIVNIRNARIKYKEETRIIMKKYSTVDEDLEENLTEKSESHHSDESIPKSNSQEEIRHSTSLTSTQKLSELEELEYLKKYEGKNYHPIKTTLFILTIVITVIYSLLQGTSSIKSSASDSTQSANLLFCNSIEIPLAVRLSVPPRLPPILRG